VPLARLARHFTAQASLTQPRLVKKVTTMAVVPLHCDRRRCSWRASLPLVMLVAALTTSTSHTSAVAAQQPDAECDLASLCADPWACGGVLSSTVSNTRVLSTCNTLLSTSQIVQHRGHADRHPREMRRECIHASVNMAMR
jgi:hypothetical protein